MKGSIGTPTNIMKMPSARHGRPGLGKSANLCVREAKELLASGFSKDAVADFLYETRPHLREAIDKIRGRL